MPKTVATVLSAKVATLAELDTVYGLEDLWDYLEIITVDNHNHSIYNRQNQGQ